MKVALYLGSFNPFHNGHLEVVKTALNDFKMDKVIIVPTMQNPWKEEKALDFNKRIEIIDICISNDKDVYYWLQPDPKYFPHTFAYSKFGDIFKTILISSIEKELTSPYYSYATLHALKNKYCNDEIFVLCGEDTIKNIPNWMNGEQIIKDYNFLVCDRPLDSISSTEIRNKIKKKEDISKYVSPNVINLIKKYYE